MKFANVDGERRTAEPRLSGTCPVCGKAVIPKCGEVRIHHWSHRGTLTCDRWWEPETVWHRAWKDHFPKDWQEVVQTSENGEKHIADVKTEHGVVIEFQHSFLNRDERESREACYSNLVWVVHGRRRQQDMPRFVEALRAAPILYDRPRIVVVGSNQCALLRDWSASRAPVYFDFGEHEPGDALWRLGPGRQNGRMYLMAVNKSLLVQSHLEGEPLEETAAQTMARAEVYHTNLLRRVQSRPLSSFERYSIRRQRKRSRF